MLCKTLAKTYSASVTKNNYGGVPTSGWAGNYFLNGTQMYYDMSDFLSEEQAHKEFSKLLLSLFKEMKKGTYDDYDYGDYDYDADQYYD